MLAMVNTINTYLDHLLGNNYLSKVDNKFLKPCQSKPGVSYGMCKVNKGTTNFRNVPSFRPILSAINSCTYNFAEFLLPILKDFATNEYSIRDYFSFGNEMHM